MNIKDFLKSIAKTKSELAKDLELSRPTLNQYIEMYETGKKIENERYNIIFDRLFSDEEMTRKQFDINLASVKFLLERDRKYDIGNLNPEDADMVARIHNKMIQDLGKNNWNKKVYDTILILLENYRSDTVMNELACYYSDLNSNSDLSDLSEKNKTYYSYYNMVLGKIEDKEPKYNDDEYKQFLRRRDEIREEKRESIDLKSKKIRRKMQQILADVEKEFIQKKEDVSEYEIMHEVIRRMKQG